MDKDEIPLNRGKLPTEENERIFLEQILPRAIAGSKHHEQPMAIFVGGQPGVGKSRLISLLGKAFQNFSVVNGDDLRTFHPQMEYFLETAELDAADLTQPDCNIWVEKLIDRISQENGG